MIFNKATTVVIFVAFRGSHTYAVFTIADPTTKNLAYVRASGGFCVSRVPSTITLMRFLRNTVLFKFQNLCKARTLCTGDLTALINRSSHI